MPWTDSPLSGPHQSQARTPQGPPATRPGRPRGRIARGCPGPRSRSPSSPFARSSTALRSRARPSFRDPSRLRKPNPRAVLLSEGPRGRGPGPAGPGYETATDEHVTFAPRNWASAKARRPAPSTFSSSSPSPRSIPVSSAGATYLGPGLLAQAMRDAEELALASYVLRGPRAPRRGPRPRRRAWFSTPSTWADEVRTSRRIVGRPAAVRPEEVTLARRLIAEAGRLPARGLPRTAAGLGLSTAPPTRPGAGDPLRPPPGQPRPRWWISRRP